MIETGLTYQPSLFPLAERSRALVYSMIAVVRLWLVRVQTRLRPMRKKFRQVQKHSNRVMGYRVCQLILCHNNILIIGEWQSLQINSWGRPKLNSE